MEVAGFVAAGPLSDRCCEKLMRLDRRGELTVSEFSHISRGGGKDFSECFDDDGIYLTLDLLVGYYHAKLGVRTRVVDPDIRAGSVCV
jgi:hypothetical protein